jgi:glycogen(starch) synthase
MLDDRQAPTTTASDAPVERAGIRPLRVVLSPSAYYPQVGGIEELTRQIARTLMSRGHRVWVLTNRWPPGVSHSDVLDGVSVTRLRFPLPAGHPIAAAGFLASAPQAALALVRQVRGVRPDVVHVIGAGPQAAYLGALLPTLGTRLVFTAQGELTFDAHNVFEHSATLRAALRRMLRTADAVTACSAYVAAELAAVAARASEAAVIPNGVAPEDFAVTRPTATGRPYVLGVGRLVPQKGFDTLIEAFASEELASLDLVIAGEGFEHERLVRHAVALGLEGRVRLVGAAGREPLVGLLAQASVFALPSRSEPFGIALLEAMAAGVPAVATRAGGVVEFARDGTNALLVKPDDPVALAKSIARLYSDPPLRTRLIEAGRLTARELAWSEIVPRYERIYIRVGEEDRLSG